MKRLSLLALLILCVPVQAQGKKDDPGKVIFPELPQPPQPKPPPTPPGMPINLTSDMLYVIRSSVKCVMVTSPPGIIKIVPDSGPMKIRAKFIEAPNEWQTKSYTEKFIYTVEAVAIGKAELIVVPEGADEGGVIRKCFDVTLAPRPPPDPNPPDPPGPTPEPTDTLYLSLKVAWAQEAATDKGQKKDLLSALYKQASATASDKSVTTIKQFFDKVHAARLALVGDALPKVRAAVGAYLNAGEAKTGNLDDATRIKLAADFAKINQYLEVLK